MKRTPRRSEFYTGLDLGQAQQHTALAVLQKSYALDAEEPRVETWSYALRHLERFPPGTPYAAVFDEVGTLFGEEELWGTLLIVDQTGVGKPVIDLLRASDVDADVRTVTVTAGQQASLDAGTWAIPKKELVGVLQVLLQARRLKVAPGLPEARTLVRELTTFQAKVTVATGEPGADWREGSHDDLVLALAIAAWMGERHVPQEPGLPYVYGDSPWMRRGW